MPKDHPWASNLVLFAFFGCSLPGDVKTHGGAPTMPRPAGEPGRRPRLRPARPRPARPRPARSRAACVSAAALLMTLSSLARVPLASGLSTALRAHERAQLTEALNAVEQAHRAGSGRGDSDVLAPAWTVSGATARRAAAAAASSGVEPLLVPASSFVEVAAGVGISVGTPPLGTCKSCVYVLERIKQGYEYVLPSICIEVYKGGMVAGGSSSSSSGGSGPGTDFGSCHEVLAAMSVWGNNVRSWMHDGCYKVEAYGAMELISPCPSHIICSQLTAMSKKPFCKPVVPDPLLDGV